MVSDPTGNGAGIDSDGIMHPQAMVEPALAGAAPLRGRSWPARLWSAAPDWVFRVLGAGYFFGIVAAGIPDYLRWAREYAESPGEFVFAVPISSFLAHLTLLIVGLGFIFHLRPQYRASGTREVLIPLIGTFWPGLPLALLAVLPFIEPGWGATFREFVWAQELSSARFVVGIALTIAGNALDVWGYAVLFRSISISAEARELKVTGPYALVRHPVYLGHMLAQGGIWLCFANTHAVWILFYFMFVALQLYRAWVEDDVLQRAFGERHRAWMRATFWFITPPMPGPDDDHSLDGDAARAEDVPQLGAARKWDMSALRIAVLVFVGALIVRGVYLHQSAGNPTFFVPIVDAEHYDTLARALAAGQEMNESCFWQPVFYPFFLTVVYFLLSPSVLWPKLIQAVLGAVTCVLTYRLGERLFDRRTGAVAGFAVALYGPLIFFEGELLAGGWAAFWSVTLVLLFLRAHAERTVRLCFWLGVCGALSVLTRPTFLPFFVTGCLWLLVVLRRGSPASRILPEGRRCCWGSAC